MGDLDSFICLKLSWTIKIAGRMIAAIKYAARKESENLGNAVLPRMSQGYWSAATPIPR